MRGTDPDGRKAQVDGQTKRERKRHFRELKRNLRDNGATRKELRSLHLNKSTGEVTQSGGSVSNASPAFGSFQSVVGDDNMATIHFVPNGGSATANNGSVVMHSELLKRGGALSTLDLNGDTSAAGGVDVEVWVAEGGFPGGVVGASGGKVPDPENLMAAHEMREGFEWMTKPNANPQAAHQVATDFENLLRSMLGFALRAP